MAQKISSSPRRFSSFNSTGYDFNLYFNFLLKRRSEPKMEEVRRGR
jgi:hypothetical protein